MAKLYGMHHLELRPEVTPEAFEHFVTTELSHMLARPGQRIYILKGERGEHTGKYVFVFEYASVEARDRDTPGPNQDSEELKQWLQEHHNEVDRLFERLATFVLPDGGIGHHYTDYVEIEPAVGGPVEHRPV